MRLPLDVMVTRLFYLFGWIPFALVMLWGAKEIWLSYIRSKWGATVKYVLLAIDIPRGNEQSPKAVENIFTYLAGAQPSFNLIEKYWLGMFQLSFSLEIVSIDGYTQFLIHAPVQYRDLVESAIYSQYPDAEITEVDDYAKNVPARFPDDEYDIAGFEFIQVKSPAYPIKIYKDFEHQFGEPETQFKDPMASLMDLYSSLKRGEQIWYQIILIPLGFDWMDIGDKEISKILGETVKKKANILEKVIDLGVSGLGFLSDMIFWGAGTERKEEKQDDSFKMFNLKPKEKKQIEAIQEKVSKLGFEFKIRFIYLAKKDVMNKPKALNGFVGYMKQFVHMDLNNLKPDSARTSTKAEYFFSENRSNKRKNRLIHNYIKREDWAGRKPGILNIEELASLWHFPIEAVVKAPLIQKAPGRKAEPPMALPMGEEPGAEGAFEAEIASRGHEDVFAELTAAGEGKEAEGKPLEDIVRGKPGEGSIFTQEVIGRKGAPPDNLPVA